LLQIGIDAIDGAVPGVAVLGRDMAAGDGSVVLMQISG